MTKLIAAVAITCAGTALLLAQAGTAARSQATPTAKPAASTAAATQVPSAPGARVAPVVQHSPIPAGDAKTYREFLNQYCVNCHNSRSAQPTSDPVDLEKSSLDDVLANAATWERVLRKLSVRAMPPQGMKRPSEADYAGFTTWLAN